MCIRDSPVVRVNDLVSDAKTQVIHEGGSTKPRDGARHHTRTNDLSTVVSTHPLLGRGQLTVFSGSVLICFLANRIRVGRLWIVVFVVSLLAIPNVTSGVSH